MDFEYDPDPSPCVARLLDSIIGTDDHVMTNRKLILLTEYYLNVFENRQFIMSGSRAEGYELKTSDGDGMLVNRNVLVMEAEPPDIALLKENTILLMKTDACQPGYAMLQSLLSSVHRSHYRDSFQPWGHRLVLSSMLFRNQISIPIIADSHGPCMSGNAYGINIDLAHCFECKHWPSGAREFLRRSRMYGWPNPQLLNNIERKGCHLVAIGDKTSHLEALQWRLSFAMAERMLVYSFNHTQLRVYVLLKLFKVQVIDKYEQAEDLLCSYFIKTIVFYMIENTPAWLWCEKNLISLFWRCFNKLVDLVECGSCPNFFIPEDNLFRSKIYGENRKILLEALHEIKREGWKTIFRCKDLENLKMPSFTASLMRDSADLRIGERRKDCIIYGATMNLSSTGYHFPITTVLWKVWKTMHLSEMHNLNELNIIIARFTLGSIGMNLFCQLRRQKTQIGSHGCNKNAYASMKMCEGFLSECAKVDMGRGPLNLALFYYAVKRYEKVIKICDDLFSKMTPCVVHFNSVSQGDDGLTDVEMYTKITCGRGMSISEKMRTAVVFGVTILPALKEFYPKELGHDIAASMLIPLFYSPLPFAAFLKFLCHHQLGNIDSSFSVLGDLRILVRDERQGCRRYPLVLNLLAICLVKIGDTKGAVEACHESLKLKPHLNGARDIIREIFS